MTNGALWSGLGANLVKERFLGTPCKIITENEILNFSANFSRASRILVVGK